MSIFEVIGTAVLNWGFVAFMVFLGILAYISAEVRNNDDDKISILGIIVGGLVAFSGIATGIFTFTTFSIHLKWELIFIVFVPLWSGIIIAMNLPIIGGAEK